MDLTLIWKTVLIGIVEGVTEFLPVSSTGHIILAEELLHFEGPPGKVFDIVIQLGAILAVVFLYRVKLWTTARGVLQRDRRAIRFAAAVIAAFLPAAVVGVIAYKAIKEHLFNPTVVSVSLIVGGIAILVIERVVRRPRIKSGLSRRSRRRGGILFLPRHADHARRSRLRSLQEPGDA
jgi:undecaprenyl-diphosphatase